MKKLNIKKEFLKQEYTTKRKSSIEIAKKLKCSDKTICDYLKKYKIKIRTLSESHIGKNKDKNNGRYIDGRTKRKHYCKDCEKEISNFSGIYGQGRCGSCCRKDSKCPNYNPERHKKHYCIDCKKKICYDAWKYRNKKCRSCAQKERFKNPKNHYNYIDGKGYEPYTSKFTQKLKEIIRKRDNYTCQNCGMTEEEHIIIYGTVLEIHHIDYNKENCDKNNLITLCKQCNIRANFNRDYWYAYFTYIIKQLPNVEIK